MSTPGERKKQEKRAQFLKAAFERGQDLFNIMP